MIHSQLEQFVIVFKAFYYYNYYILLFLHCVII